MLAAMFVIFYIFPAAFAVIGLDGDAGATSNSGGGSGGSSGIGSVTAMPTNVGDVFKMNGGGGSAIGGSGYNVGGNVISCDKGSCSSHG